MNKLLKLGLLSVALLTAAVVQASSKIIVKAAKTKKVEISLGEVVSPETLTIKDIQEVVLFSKEIIKGDSFVKTFDFSKIPTGVYFIEVKETEKIEVTPLVITKEGALIVPNSTKSYLAPRVSLDGKEAKVFVQNFNKELVKLSVVNNAGIELYESQSEELVSYNAFNFEDVEEGTYKLYTSIGDYSFEDTIVIE